MFDWANPYEMLCFLDEDILEGRVHLHGWQIQFMLDFASKDWNSECPFKAAVRACNGSGKDKYIIAACLVWFTMIYKEAVGVTTSSSGTQLDRQTNTYIKQLAEKVNNLVGEILWKINYRHYEFLPQQSTIELFVTDEPGRAEGWHPKVIGGKLALFTSESKSVPDEIFTALARCTGFSHRVDVSSPGLPQGYFFNLCQSSVNRKTIKNAEDSKGRCVEYHVTAYDCSHLSLAYIEELKQMLPGGENGAVFKSCVLAEFGTTDEMTVIPYQHVWKCLQTRDRIEWLREDTNTGGLDLSAGGDETVLAIRNGNKLIKIIPFRFDNTQDTVNFLVEKFHENILDKHNAFIYADAGGLGKPIIDQLRSKGWTNIRYVLNQGRAYNERVYLNRGAEMWFKFGKLLETGEILLTRVVEYAGKQSEDDRLGRQLSTRYYKITDGNKHKLESKLQARAAGRPSPDRADAVVLAFSDYKTKLDVDDKDVVQDYSEAVNKIEAEKKPFVQEFSLKTWASGTSDENYMKQFSTVHSKDIMYLRRELTRVNNTITKHS